MIHQKLHTRPHIVGSYRFGERKLFLLNWWLVVAFENFGVTHEISLAYSFTPNLTEDRVMLEKEGEELVSNDENVPQDSLNITDKDLEIARLQDKLAENDAILDELLMPSPPAPIMPNRLWGLLPLETRGR